MGEVFAVRARTADGSVVDLLLFSVREMADRYAAQLLLVLPLGFDAIEVVVKTIIGPIAFN